MCSLSVRSRNRLARCPTDEDDLPAGKTQDDLADYLASLSLAMTLRLGGWVVGAVGASLLPTGKLGLGCIVSTASACVIVLVSLIGADAATALGSPVTWSQPSARILAMYLLALAFVQHRGGSSGVGSSGNVALMGEFQPS